MEELCEPMGELCEPVGELCEPVEELYEVWFYNHRCYCSGELGGDIIQCVCVWRGKGDMASLLFLPLAIILPGHHTLCAIRVWRGKGDMASLLFLPLAIILPGHHTLCAIRVWRGKGGMASLFPLVPSSGHHTLCAIRGLKLLITNILAGLMENDLSKIMDFDDFFKEIEKVNRKKVSQILTEPQKRC